MMDYWTKEPGDNIEKPFTAGWGDRLARTSDAIQDAAWTVPTGITKVSESNTSTDHTIIVKGGMLGKVYRLTSSITTINGVRERWHFDLVIEHQV